MTYSMAQKLDFNLPFNDLTQYVPSNLRNTVINGLLDNLFNRFMTRDESVPLYGYAGRRPTSTDDRSPRIPQLTSERDINAITPVLSFKVGTERITFTVQDLLAKASRIGIDDRNQSWLYSQGNNFCPPIDFDKFSNFFNYYWVARAVSSTPPMGWNPEKLPEYYVIQRPRPSDLTKLNCRTSSNPAEQFVLTGSGFIDQTFTLTFTSPTQFVLKANASLLGPLGVWEPSAVMTDYAGTETPVLVNVMARELTFNLPAVPAASGTPTPTTENEVSRFRFVVRRPGLPAGPAGPVTLVEFKVTRDATFDEFSNHDGYTQYESGDVLTIDTTYLSQVWSVSFFGSSGSRPVLGGVRTYNQYQTIGGVQVREGDRVLIQSPASVAGIYVVSAGTWVRAPDFNSTTWASGARTFVTEGTNASTLWEAQAGVNPGDWGWVLVGSETNTSDWQEANFWVKGTELELLGIEKSQAIQAVRPIIEYSSKLQLNGRVEGGAPTDWVAAGGRNFIQQRAEFNQLPLFDLFRYDGTHAGLVSSIFYYVEDLTAGLDVALQRRVKRANNDSLDFLFNHGCVSAEGHLLFYKEDGALKTVWHAGYIEPTVVDSTPVLQLVEEPSSRAFTGTGNGTLSAVVSTADVEPQTVTITFLSPTTFSVEGSITGQVGTGSTGTAFTSPLASFLITAGVVSFTAGTTFTFGLVRPGTITAITAADTTQQQVWTVTCVSPTTFEVAGSKNVVVPSPANTATVGMPYSNGEIGFTINSTVAPFSVGDTFLIRVGALERPRYVFRDDNDLITDRFGGPAADLDGEGAYAVSRTFIHNPYNDNRSELTEGVTYSHFRSILNNQVVSKPMDLAFGGQIKLWSEQHTLLASLLMQRDLTPISMIDLARRLYEAGLNAYRELYIQQVVDFFSQEMVAGVSGSTPTPAEKARIAYMLDAFADIRSRDDDVRRVLADSTAGVPGFPSTLPQLGITELIYPYYAFDRVLGREVFVHHDGHSSVPYVDTAEFRQEILGSYIDKLVQRSDGTSTPAIGSFTNTPPTQPYKGTLWLLPSGELRAFDVNYDTVSTPPVVGPGERWYQRSANVLYESTSTTWVPQPSPLVAWKTIDLAETLNELIFQIEERLHRKINPNQRRYDFAAISSNPFYLEQLQRELFTFAAREGLDPLATNYNAQDPFTWNYHSAVPATFAPVSTPAVPARWYNALVAHHQTVLGVIPTERPNLEPWKLLGFSTYTAWWSTLTALQQASFVTGVTEGNLGTYVDGGTVQVVATVHVASLVGLPTIDGVAVPAGSTVLLTNQLSPINNGLWVVSVGGWTRSPNPIANRFFTVLEGTLRSGTRWAVTGAGIVGLDPVTVVQVRQWSDALWAHVQVTRPTLRLSLDPYTDELLPPFVSVSSPLASFALTNVLPTGITQPFIFGEGSPVEEVWERSVEYGYAQAKALFRFDPMAFLGFCWGFNWVEVDGILYDGMDVSMPGHRRFVLHGEPTNVTRSATFNFNTAAGVVGTKVYTVTFDAYDTSRRQNFSVRNIEGAIVGFVVEGISTSVTLTDGVTLAGLTPLIEDQGVPFRTGDTFNLTLIEGGLNVSVFKPAREHQVLGFGQIFANALREVSIDTQTSYAISAYREWDVNMGYRAGGLVATDDLRVYTESDTLSSASYDLIFKKNEGARSLWLQALRVVLVQRGTTGIDPVTTSNPADRPTPNLLPGSAAQDWVFRIEGYNPNYLELPYYSLQGIPGGTSFPPSPSVNDRFFRHDQGEAYTWDGAAWVKYAANIQTFKALEQEATTLSWYQPLTQLGVVNGRLPITITGLQNVVNFLFGYAQYAEEQGWVFDSSTQTRVDLSNGRHRTWQLEIEVLVDRMYRGIDLGTGHVVNPFIDLAQLKQETGLLAPFSEASLFDIYGHAAAFDILGSKISTSDLNVQRGNLMSTVRSAVPVFSMHALIDEYEHLFIFDNFINASDGTGVLYDPFSGGRVVTYKFNGRRQNSGTLRPEFGGHYLAGNQVRRNLQASTDSLADAYDADFAFENTLQSKHALALLGFNRKDYFTDLDITDKSQFNFWRGLIQAKGTNMSIDAYLNNDRFKEAKLDEYWAYKVAEYGDARQRAFPELRLKIDDSFQQFTLLQFDAPSFASPDDEAPGQLVNFAQISRFDESRWFTIDDLNQDTYFKADTIGVFTRPVMPGDIVTLPFIADEVVGTGAAYDKLNAQTLRVTIGGNLLVIGYGPATPRYNPVKLFNYVEDQLVEEIPLWHPAIGQHTPTALESINTISDVNPARYNYSTLVVNNNSFDPLRPWADREVGRVWFDTRRLSYIPYYDPLIFPNRAERLSRWGSIADFASIDVYEWVKSSVPPAEYNALARLDAGNADLDASVKASGEVALEETYVRDRLWAVRPVAWSYSPVPTDTDWEDRPPMKYSGDISGFFTNTSGLFANRPIAASAGFRYFATDTETLFEYTGSQWVEIDSGQLSVNGVTIYLASGTFGLYGIAAGDRIGTWQHGLDPMPLTEGTINDDFKLVLLGNELTVPNFSVELSVIDYPATRMYGPLTVTAEPPITVNVLDADGLATDQWDISYYVTISNDTGGTEQVLAYIDRETSVAPPVSPTITLTNNQVLTYDFPLSGLRVRVTYTGPSGAVAAGAIAQAIEAALDNQFSIKDGVTVTWLTPAPASGNYSNDEADPIFTANGGIGWRVWSVPTQAQLDADGRQPVCSWKPYVGSAVPFSPTYDQLQEAIAYEGAPLTLNNGTVVERYAPTWSDWQVLRDIRQSVTALATGPVTFQAGAFGLTRFDLNRTAVYINGIAQVKAAYVSDGPTLTVNTVRLGSVVDVVVLRYQPTTEELAFNPDAEDNYSFQRHYKKDYEYVALQQRDRDGNLGTTVYYFWVKNKSTVATGKKLSVQAIRQQLLDGPPNFLTFQHLLPEEPGLPWRYDAITLSGLSYVVTKDNTFKLRFTRNFTLRDDPNDLDLKNTHTEWSLMRPAQRNRIPEPLWLKLVDSTAGEDAAGNVVPSLRRELYDERRGTSTRFGFGPEQTLAPSWLLRTSLASSIVNTKLRVETPSGIFPDFIQFIDQQLDLMSFASVKDPMIQAQLKELKVQQVVDTFFADPQQVRQTMTQIWAQASVQQVNEMFFAALEDILANNFELTDIFKTSRLSMYSIQEKRPGNVLPNYE